MVQVMVSVIFVVKACCLTSGPVLSSNGAICGKKVIEHKMCVCFSLQILSETIFLLRRM